MSFADNTSAEVTFQQNFHWYDQAGFLASKYNPQDLIFCRKPEMEKSNTELQQLLVWSMWLRSCQYEYRIPTFAVPNFQTSIFQEQEGQLFASKSYNNGTLYFGELNFLYFGQITVSARNQAQ